MKKNSENDFVKNVTSRQSTLNQEKMHKHTNSKIVSEHPTIHRQGMQSCVAFVLDCAKKMGASDAVASVEQGEGFSVDVRLGQVETVTFHNDQSIGITVYLGHRKGSASSSDLSQLALQKMVTAAYAIAQSSSEDHCFEISDEATGNVWEDLDLYHRWDITPNEAIEKAIQCENIARSRDSRITNSDGVNITTFVSQQVMGNSRGFLGVQCGTRHAMSCSLMAEEKDSMQRDYAYTCSRKMEDLLSLDALAQLAADRTLSRLLPRKIKTQVVPVIFSARVAKSLLSTLVAGLSGSNLYRKKSFLVDSLGQTLFPSFVRIYEQPHLLRALGSAPFDSDGVATRNNIIVNEGRLNQYILGYYSAKKMGMKTTANGGGVFNLTIDPTVGGLTDLIKKVDKAVLITELIGDATNIVTGDFSRGASGFWIENGEVQYPIEEMTIAGKLRDIYQNIEAIGADLELSSATRCGSILVNSMMIGAT